MKAVTILASFAFLVPLAGPLANATAQTPRPITSTTQREQQTKQSLSQALLVVHKKYNVNVVTEIYRTDPILEPSIHIRVADSIKTTGPELLQQIASQAECELTQLDGVYILRNRKALQRGPRAASDPDNAIPFGPIKITPRAARYEDVNLPVHKVDVLAPGNPLSEFMTALQKSTHLTVRADKELENRRICVYAQDVTPASLLNAVGTLLNAGPEIVLRPTDAQRQLEKDVEFSANEGFAKRMGLSRELYAATSKLLTAEQLQQRQNGQFAELSLSSLSPDLQKSAMDYIKFSASQAGTLISLPDMSKWQEFSLRFGPPRSGPPDFLGITIVGSDGTEYSF